MTISSNSSINDFGLLVAYLLPGFVVLVGVAHFVPDVAAWLHPAGYTEASLGPPVYAVLTALTSGMIVSCFRWIIIDRVHSLSGLKPPAWDARELEGRLATFDYLVENHYRYYQFFSNTLVALGITYTLNRWAGTSLRFGIPTDLAMLALCCALFFGSRDALGKYYARTRRLLGVLRKKDENQMTNGIQHDVPVGTATGRSQRKSQGKQEATPKPPPPQAPKPQPGK